MTHPDPLERISEIQSEIIQFTWSQIPDEVEKFYIQGKISDDERGNITLYSGLLDYAVVGGKVVNNSDVLPKEDLRKSSSYVGSRIVELHDLPITLQGRSPVRFRWAVDVKSEKVESEWTYYDDLTDEEKRDDFWEGWKGDTAWKAQLQAELAADQRRAEMLRSVPSRARSRRGFRRIMEKLFRK